MIPAALRSILPHFELGGELIALERFGAGNIHDTYRSLVRPSHRGTASDCTFSYIHQKISQAVFPSPDKIMANMVLITSHLQEKLAQTDTHGRKTTVELIPTRDGRPYYVDKEGEYWRTMVFIPDAVVYNVVQNLQHAYEAGRILGEFQKFVSDIPPGDLYDILPGFHHTPVYYRHFCDVLDCMQPEPSIEARKREPEARDVINQIRRHDALVPLLMTQAQNGLLREQVVHNDPKINNIMLDIHTQQGLCMIDLDTVKSGLLHFDYGDCLRSAANPAGEEARELGQVCFDLDIFEQISKGYLSETAPLLSDADVHALVDSIKVIAFELGTRFFTDYLEGDVYFKTSSPRQNLNRARVQFTLLADIEAKESAARTIIQRLIQASRQT